MNPRRDPAVVGAVPGTAVGSPSGAGSETTTSSARRVPWLDGVRAAAALFVVLHHLWISVWPAYPDNGGPSWLGWLAPGQLGVVVFIVVSGYSLTLAPARHGLHLPGGSADFARRRAWRILPPYWAALVICTALVTIQTGWLDLRSFGVHAVLLQDVLANTPANGTFWSIAVEAQIYVVFPLMLLLARRRSTTATTALVVGLVVVGHLLATAEPGPFARLEHLTPQLAACFTFGVWAAALAQRISGPALARLRLVCWLLLPGVVAGAWALGTRRVIEGFFWVDLVVGAYVALCFLATGDGDGRLGSALAKRLPRSVGRFSYSIYLIHAPIVALVWTLVVRHAPGDDLQRFGIMLVLALPLALLAAWGFFLVFEAPFLTVRSGTALRILLAARLRTLHTAVSDLTTATVRTRRPRRGGKTEEA